MPRVYDPAIEPGLGSTSEKLAVLPQEQSFCLESPTKGLPWLSDRKARRACVRLCVPP